MSKKPQLRNFKRRKEGQMKNKILETRMKEDYLFLSKLELEMEKQEITKNIDNEENVDKDTGDYVLNMVKDGKSFLNHRAEFWTNMK